MSSSSIRNKVQKVPPKKKAPVKRKMEHDGEKPDKRVKVGKGTFGKWDWVGHVNQCVEMAATGNSNNSIVVTTSLGQIKAKVCMQEAPVTAGHICKLVKKGCIMVVVFIVAIL